MLKVHEKEKLFILSSVENEQLLLINSQWSLKTYPFKQEKEAIVGYWEKSFTATGEKSTIKGSKLVCYSWALESKTGLNLGGMMRTEISWSYPAFAVRHSFYRYLYIATSALIPFVLLS